MLILLPIALVFSDSSMANLQTVSIIAAFPLAAVILLIVASFLKDGKKYLEENPDIAADVEAQIRANFDKLMGNQSRIAAAKAAGKAVNVSADDFNDED